MAGLNFQTQTIINANVDKDSNNAVLFEKASVKVDGVTKDVLKVKRDFLFVKDVKLIEIFNKYGLDSISDYSDKNWNYVMSGIPFSVKREANTLLYSNLQKP